MVTIEYSYNVNRIIKRKIRLAQKICLEDSFSKNYNNGNKDILCSGLFILNKLFL